MDLDNLLNEIQQGQLAQHLERMLGWGFGHLEIRIEKCAVRWLRPSLAIYNPLSTRIGETGTGKTLEELLGPWMEPLAGELARVCGDGFGSILIGVDHGRIRLIETSIDVRARTGKTGDIRPSSSLQS